MIKLYGIPNCDTVKKARQWLAEHGVDYEFYDFKKMGVPEQVLNQWLKEFGWQTVVNSKGTTWRKLSEQDKVAVDNIQAAKSILLQNASMIKRPILKSDKGVTIGFDITEFEKLL